MLEHVQTSVFLEDRLDGLVLLQCALGGGAGCSSATGAIKQGKVLFSYLGSWV